MDLPKNERSFIFESTGSATNKKYEGTFVVKCVLTIGEKRRLEIEKSRQMADLTNPTEELRIMASVISNLSTRVISSPDWFKQFMGDDILDHNVIYDLYGKVMDQEDAWRKEVKEKASLGN